jgi:hypothetical protein
VNPQDLLLRSGPKRRGFHPSFGNTPRGAPALVRYKSAPQLLQVVLPGWSVKVTGSLQSRHIAPKGSSMLRQSGVTCERVFDHEA